MISAAQIISGSMLLISIAILMLTIFTDRFTRPVKLKKYFVATTIVFVSGIASVAVIVSVKREIPLAFTLISLIMILAIYLFSTFMIKRLGKSIEDFETKE